MDQNTTRGGTTNLHSLAYDLPVYTFAMLAVSIIILVCLLYLHYLCFELWQRKEILRLLPVVTYRRGSEANGGCVVCLGDFEEGEELKLLGCGHLFHPECIQQWILQHCSCPVCRCSDLFGENNRVTTTAPAAAAEESGVEVEVGGDLGVRLESCRSWSDRVADDGMRVAAIRHASSF